MTNNEERMQLLKSLSDKNNITHLCPECNNAVKCEIEQGKSTCWCFSVQVSNALSTGDICVCRKCLS